MRGFIILCFVAIACADKLGYNYQPVGHSNSGLSFAPGATYNAPSYSSQAASAPAYGGHSDPTSYFTPSYSDPSASYETPSYGGSPSFGGQGGSPSFGGQGGSPSFGGQGGSPSFGGQGGSPSYNTAQGSFGSPSYAPQSELDKEFITYSANDAEFNDPSASNQLSNSLKQGLRVLFIKGPENRGLEDAALALANHAANQKTAIYVLNKQADIGDLANKLNGANSHGNNRPEVHFVKYRTPEDAVHAQHAIQSQYDSLGGNSHHINGGVAPSLNFASQAPAAAPSAISPHNSYLPSAVFRH